LQASRQQLNRSLSNLIVKNILQDYKGVIESFIDDGDDIRDLHTNLTSIGERQETVDQIVEKVQQLRNLKQRKSPQRESPRRGATQRKIFGPYERLKRRDSLYTHLSRLLRSFHDIDDLEQEELRRIKRVLKLYIDGENDTKALIRFLEDTALPLEVIHQVVDIARKIRILQENLNVSRGVRSRQKSRKRNSSRLKKANLLDRKIKKYERRIRKLDQIISDIQEKKY